MSHGNSSVASNPLAVGFSPLSLHARDVLSLHLTHSISLGTTADFPNPSTALASHPVHSAAAVMPTPPDALSLSQGSEIF